MEAWMNLTDVTRYESFSELDTIDLTVNMLESAGLDPVDFIDVDYL